MKVLVACEESQVVCNAFRAKGHEAYSCDILPTRGAHPEWHIHDDALKHLGDGWDLLIAHPDCTYLANSGVSHLYNKDKTINTDRWNKMKQGAEFFRKFYFSDVHYGIPRICVENPIMHGYAKSEIGIRFFQSKYPNMQVVQPWMFGHPEQKATCLWLVNLPPLKETNNVKQEMKLLPDNKRQRLHYLPPSESRKRIRSRTFDGLAEAMADQWGCL